MVALVGNWVGELTATTGVGDVALGGALPGYTTFSSVAADGSEFWYAIADGDDRESGIGTLSAGIMSRATIATLVDGSYVAEGASPLDLSGSAQIYCTFNKSAYEEFVDHMADADVHFPDAPANGNAYARKDNAWVLALADTPTGLPVGYGGLNFNGSSPPTLINESTYVLVDGWTGISPSDLLYPPAGVLPDVLTSTLTCEADGVWQLGFAITFVNNLYGGIKTSIFINGNNVEISSSAYTGNVPGVLSVSCSGIGFLAGGDVIDLRVIRTQNETSELTMSSGEFYLIRIG